MDLINQYNHKLLAKYMPVARSGCRRFDFLGGRRSGKSYLIEQILLGRMLMGDVVSVATMTSEQGRLGVYADVCDIIAGSPSVKPFVEILKSPRQIECKSGGRMFFNSYQDPERAKGIACDWLYINEANNFTERQYIDLSASVRKGVFADRNPNSECWTERNGFTLIHSTWKDNDYLTEQQREWFENLRRKAESPDATSADIAFYRMYYLGEYAEILGEIFTPTNILRGAMPEHLLHPVAYCDPSALWGSDHFACVLSGVCDDKVYIIDTHSPNAGSREDIILKLQDWQERYKDLQIYIETNGAIGQEFYRYARGAFPRLSYFNQTQNKFDRIMANYENITQRVVFVDSPANDDFLQQVYTFGKKCEHDDNIDAVDTTFTIHRIKHHIR